MEALASIDLFNFDDTAFAPAHGIDGMHAKPAIANEPRNYLLGHSLSFAPRKGRMPRLFLALELRLSGDRILQSSARTCAQLSLREARSRDRETRFDREQRSNLEAMTSMHARCGLSRVTVLRWVATFECPWKSLRNGQQPIATHARMSSSKGLEKRRQHGPANSVAFQPVFRGAWPRMRRRERRPRTIWRRSRSGRS